MRALGFLVALSLSACTYQRMAEVVDAHVHEEPLADLRRPDPIADLSTDASPDADAEPTDAAIEPCTPLAPTTCPTPAPTYADVAPIIAARCHHCHDGSGPEWGLTTYGHVADWQDTIHDALLSCEMPPLDASVPITNAERELILAWLLCGLPP